MRTNVDSALKEIADWYVKNRRGITPPELHSILLKHCGSEVDKFTKFLLTEPGQLRFKTLLRERKSESSHLEAKPQHTTTMEERFTIDCSYCGFLTTERTLNDAFVAARQLAQRHNTPEEKITIYDRLAQKGACQVYDIEGNCVGYKPFSEEKPSYLKEPFIKVGERVRYIGKIKGRSGTWPEGVWLEKGMEGTVIEYYPWGRYTPIHGEEPIEAYAVVKFDNGASTAIDPEDEGERWERVKSPSYLKERMPRIDPHATAIQQDKQLIEQIKWLKAHGFKTARDAQEAGY
jgi:hypothetical protein